MDKQKSSSNGVGKLDLHMKNRTFDPYHIQKFKIDFRPQHKKQIYKASRRKHKKICNLGIGKDF